MKEEGFRISPLEPVGIACDMGIFLAHKTANPSILLRYLRVFP
jgi:hypothetical protein